MEEGDVDEAGESHEEEVTSETDEDMKDSGKRSKVGSHIEDDFMKLDEMEAFLQEAEDVEAKKFDGQDEDLDEDDLDKLLENAAKLAGRPGKKSKSGT